MQAIFFDLDGTIIDNVQVIYESYANSLQNIGISFDPRNLTSLIGKSMTEIEEAFTIPPDKRERFENLYIRHQRESDFHLVQGITELLDELVKQGSSLGLITSKMEVTTSQVLDRFNLSKYFQTVITSSNVEQTKPDPEPIRKACKKLGIRPSLEVVYIGDSFHDFDAARNAGISWIGVTWGVANVALKKYPPTVDSTGELRNLLLQ